MNKDFLEELYYRTFFIINFKTLKENQAFKSLIQLIKNILFEKEFEENIKSYSDFLSELNKINNDEYFLNIILDEKINPENKIEIEKELGTILNVLKITSANIKDELKNKFYEKSKIIDLMPDYSINFNEIKFEQLNKNYKKDYIKDNRTFVFNNDFEICPIDVVEKMNFKSLKGYKTQKETIYNNTKSFIEGFKVNNILLYGDAGCGKSTTVRALLNEFPEIKMIQIFKDNLINLDKLYLKLNKLPYKFIIFADDISFLDDDETLSTTKAILEGSLVQCPENAVIYATSNRRRLIKESFKSRLGDEIHLADTINEISSLSERFGINLLFVKPNNEEFKEIVLNIAKDYNLELDEDKIIEEAQKYALKKGSNSPRVAKQVINNLIANVKS